LFFLFRITIKLTDAGGLVASELETGVARPRSVQRRCYAAL